MDKKRLAELDREFAKKIAKQEQARWKELQANPVVDHTQAERHIAEKYHLLINP